jgi:2-oxoisovalerate dehydrogenase E2 component (dihydrolipoyl transacylase)
MGRFVFRLPDVGEGSAEAEIVAWHVVTGDMIEADAPLVDVMTDKATVEIPSPVTGKVLALHGTPGEKRAVGSNLVEFEIPGEGNARAEAVATVAASAAASASASDPHPPIAKATGPSLSSLPRSAGEGPHGAPKEPLSRIAGEGAARSAAGEGHRASKPVAVASTTPAFATRPPGEKPMASPAVRRRAWELGIALQFVPGSGPAGRITHSNLDAYIAAKGGVAAAPALARRDGVEEVKLVGLRRVIAEHLQKSARHIPHFSYVEEVDVTALEELRRHLNDTRPRQLTVLPFLMRALVKALPDFPQINARFDEEAGIVHRHAAVHIGIATQTPAGLMVPVVFHAEALDLWATAAEVARLAAAARDGKAKREELSGSTITITSLGALGGIASTPVINHPEVAIVGVNKIGKRPVVRDGQVVVRKMMNLSSSFDHRIVDGWDAAAFIQRIKALLEHPATLFLD